MSIKTFFNRTGARAESARQYLATAEERKAVAEALEEMADLWVDTVASDTVPDDIAERANLLYQAADLVRA